MIYVTTEHYFKGYAGHEEITPQIIGAAEAWCGKVNAFLERAAAAGVPIINNPITGTLISGDKNGGFRPQSCPIGAPQSKHKRARGGDLYDGHDFPLRPLASWSVSEEGRAAMREIGLWAERVEWTPGWLHLQDIAAGNPPREDLLFFVPDASPQRVALPIPWNLLKERLA